MNALYPGPDRFYLAFDPEFKPEDCPVKFRLTYEGRLEANGTAKHKHEIRKAFHPQLKRLWDMEPNLKATGHVKDARLPMLSDNMMPLWQHRGNQFARNGFRFCPLATHGDSLSVGMDILFLRPDVPGGAIQSGDLDNRLKTLFDALRMPNNSAELGGYLPGDDEDPFFVLLNDDERISTVSVETDILLSPTPTAEGKFMPNDARLIITVMLKPYKVTMENLHFA